MRVQDASQKPWEMEVEALGLGPMPGRLVERGLAGEPGGACKLTRLLTDAARARPGNGKAAVPAAAVGPAGSQL